MPDGESEHEREHVRLLARDPEGALQRADPQLVQHGEGEPRVREEELPGAEVSRPVRRAHGSHETERRRGWGPLASPGPGEVGKSVTAAPLRLACMPPCLAPRERGGSDPRNARRAGKETAA